MREPTHEEVVEGIAKGVYDALVDKRDVPYLPKKIIADSIAEGVTKAFEGRALCVSIEHAIRDGVASAVGEWLKTHPDALRPSKGGSR